MKPHKVKLRDGVIEFHPRQRMATEPAKVSGKVVNGVVVFENGESLPEGTAVRIEPLNHSLPYKSAIPLTKMLLSHAVRD